MSMGEPKKIYAKDNPELALKVTKGHFSSDRFHINYYIDMTSLKMRRKDAQADRKSTRLNSSHSRASRMPSSA